MTTAHRTTFRPTLASKDESSSLHVVQTRQFAARDCPSHKIMKDRKTFQKDFHKISNKADLRRKQNEVFRKIMKANSAQREEDQPIPTNHKRKHPKAQDIQGSNYIGQPSKPETDSSDEDADDNDFLGGQPEATNKNTEDSDTSQSEDSDSEGSDDEEAILLEYERVKKEREHRERQEIKEQVQQEGDVGQGYSLQRKWFQETVFQNQSLKEKKEKPEFCNDTVRSKFHKKVLHKFVWT